MIEISKAFGSVLALDCISLALEAGEVHALVGENGSGKSTLAKILAGAELPTSGEMLLGGNQYKPSGIAEAKSLGVSMIHQELSLCGHLSVLDNVLLGSESVSFGIIKRNESVFRAKSALNQLGLADVDLDAISNTFSIAKQQLFEIARALVLDSKVIILDEPTSSLTEADVQHLFTVVKSLAHSGKAIIFVSHFLNEIRQLCDKMTILRDGVFIKCCDVATTTDHEIVSMMVGRSIENFYPRSHRDFGEVVLELSHVQCRSLPKDASLQLRKGEILGIAGLNGSGRTELIRAIFGLEQIKNGSVHVGSNLNALTPHENWRQKIGMVSENRKEEGLAINLSIEENMNLPRLKSGFLNLKSLSSSAMEMVDSLKIKCKSPEQAIRELSGGNQQKVAIARLLVSEVDILLLDEPTRGIDVGSKQQIYELMDKLTLEGKSILVVSSYIPELLGVCDRIAVMRDGILGETMDRSNTDQEKIMEQALRV